jgi:hypothetical protein
VLENAPSKEMYDKIAATASQAVFNDHFWDMLREFKSEWILES